ncbi:MAG: glycosyltransferase family 4 protein [Flammeovirgaceae bacterium]|nr:glycosyltransferase family 4 protein [Flammeovirgaceae bacterium]
MRIIFITQVFYPDTVSVSQHLTDLANKLVENGHEVTVYTSSYPYEEKTHRYQPLENYQGIKIRRLWQSSFGKGSTLARLFDFFTYYFSISIKLFCLKKNDYDLMVGTTVPPLLSFVGVLVSKIKGIKFHYWVMDLQPELSISTGLIKQGSLSAEFFTRLGNYIIRNSTGVISLDRFMTQYLYSRGAKKDSVATIPVWPVMDDTFKGSRMSNPFRIENSFGDKVVIMYSGNHAYVHQLDTLLEAAHILRQNSRFLFVFVGGGVRKKDVTAFKVKYQLDNIVQLPFQPRENVHNSLGSSDIQVVILGNGQVGYTHPNKVYGAMYIGKPILYIGPTESHVADLLNDLERNISVQHGESKVLADRIELLFARSWDEINIIGENNMIYAQNNFHPDVLKQKMIDDIIG